MSAANVVAGCLPCAEYFASESMWWMFMTIPFSGQPVLADQIVQKEPTVIFLAYSALCRPCTECTEISALQTLSLSLVRANLESN